MGIKTEDFVKDLPPKEITAGIDWIGILDSFNPTTLDEKWNSETGESPVEFELLEKLVMICHANPYWLFDDEYEADDAAYVVEEDWCQACIFATPDVILKWIEAGKPQSTSWEDSRW